MSDYKIVISLSHNYISFEYNLKGGSLALQPITTDANRQGVWPAPFSIYCSPTGIIIGKEALYATQKGTKNAFYNLFECMKKTDCYYEFCGNKKHVSDLPLDACETVFRDFFSKDLLNNYGNLEKNRSTSPIVFVCEEDVSENEKAIIKNKFVSSGYGCVSVESYQSFIESVIIDNYNQAYKNALTIWTEGKDLYLTLFDIKKRNLSKSLKLDNLGIDSRVDFVSNQIWEAVVARNGFLNREDEWGLIRDAANDFINSLEPLVNRSLTLSDGQNYFYTLDRNTINNYQAPEREQLLNGIRNFLTSNGVEVNNTLVVLRGVASNNPYFQNVLSEFKNIINHNDLLEQITAKIINKEKIELKTTIKNDEKNKNNTPSKEKNEIGNIPDLNREWRELKATTKGQLRNGIVKEDTKKQLNNFLIDCKETDNTKLINEVEQLINEIKNIIPNNKGNEIDHSLYLNRKWKQLKATANGELRSGNIKENTKKQLSSFLIKCKEINSTKLINEVEQLINSTKPQITQKEQPQKIVIPSKVEKKVNDVEIFLQNGKLVEARNWYKNNGEVEKANKLTEIIKLEKSVIQRKKELSSCQQTKDPQKIKRIINELNNYIDKCQQIGIPVEEYKQILLEYKKIK
ncbi:MAG: hypothetical protein UHM08_04105 [Bacteroidales bacterium]|nr:hypothetical protein [Bacteroidales bacterium]